MEEAIKRAVESGRLAPAALQNLLDSSGLSGVADLAKVGVPRLI